MIFLPAADNFEDFAPIDNGIARFARKTQGRIDDAPPIIPRTRTQGYDERAIHPGFQRILSVHAGGELLFPDLRARPVEKSVFFKRCTFRRFLKGLFSLFLKGKKHRTGKEAAAFRD